MEPGCYYHVYTHANGSENLFRSDENYRYFLKKYQKHIPPVADTFAYCLMPNHVHFLIRLKEKPDLKDQGKLGGFNEKKISQPFSNLFNGYAKAYNKMYDRMGSLFIPKFKRNEITSDLQLTNTIRYIHNNPVHHNFTPDMNAWPWSSYNILLDNEETWVKKEDVIAWFGNREEFAKFHKTG